MLHELDPIPAPGAGWDEDPDALPVPPRLVTRIARAIRRWLGTPRAAALGAAVITTSILLCIDLISRYELHRAAV